MGTTEWVLGAVVILGLMAQSYLTSSKKPTRKRNTAKKEKQHTAKNTSRRTSSIVRPDEVILTSPLEDLSGFEFERLLALYYRDQGYTVHEVGVGGKDGGVDLVIINNKTGEKEAIQAKCHADHNKVDVKLIRELATAKKNHGCMLATLVTTSDLTSVAREEAEKFNVDFVHGGLLEQKLRAWGKWQPSKKRRKKNTIASEINAAKSQVAATNRQTKK